MDPVLLKTANCELTIWTYWFGPTSPSVSGGAEFTVEPARPVPRPSKPAPAVGAAVAVAFVWTTGSWELIEIGAGSSCSVSRCRALEIGPGSIVRSGGETSWWKACRTTTVGLLAPLDA